MQNKDKKILVVSQFPSSTDNYCYAELFCKLARQEGFKVSEFDCKLGRLPLGPKSEHRLWWPFRTINSWLTNMALVLRFVLVRPDVLLLVKGETIGYRTLKLLKKCFKFKLINFYPDSPFCLWNANSTYSVVRSLPLYDRFAIWSRLLSKTLVASGARQVFYWPFVCDSELFKPAAKESSLDLASDVCFVGSWDGKREEWLSELVVREPEVDLKIWGDGWDNLAKGSVLASKVQGGTLTPDKMAVVFAQAKIVLNFLRDQNYTSHNMRTFEAASCGAFLLTERSDEQAKELFVEGESIACFSGAQELRRQVVYYLTVEKDRKRIAQAAQARCNSLCNAGQMFRDLVG